MLKKERNISIVICVFPGLAHGALFRNEESIVYDQGKRLPRRIKSRLPPLPEHTVHLVCGRYLCFLSFNDRETEEPHRGRAAEDLAPLLGTRRKRRIQFINFWLMRNEPYPRHSRIWLGASTQASAATAIATMSLP